MLERHIPNYAAKSLSKLEWPTQNYELLYGISRKLDMTNEDGFSIKGNCPTDEGPKNQSNWRFFTLQTCHANEGPQNQSNWISLLFKIVLPTKHPGPKVISASLLSKLVMPTKEGSHNQSHS